MALKAYKHLTDGEVKIVNEGSAEETSLLADTVTGSSYLQLTSTGHAQEVAAAQGTALWVDVTSDLGGSSFAHLSENTDDTRLEAGSELLKLGVAGETNHRVFLNPTSIRFTNGSEVGGGAEAKIRREVVGGKIQLIATVGSTDVVLATEP
jgi:hypothetical protein